MAEFSTAGTRRTARDAQRERIMARDHTECRYCGDLATVIDHVMPYVWGGRTKDENLVASCRTCNHIAGAHVFESFEEKRDFVVSRRAGRPDLDKRTICVDCGREFDYSEHGTTRFLCAECNSEDATFRLPNRKKRTAALKALNKLL